MRRNHGPASTGTGGRHGPESAYDEAGHLIGEYDAEGDLVEETVWFEDIPVATLKPNGGSGISVFYIHTDHLNTPRRITRPSDNAIVWRWDSDPFGDTAADDDPDSDMITFAYHMRFPGQYFDTETGLHYNYFRDYDAVTGRYIQSDPIGLGGGINTYAYVDGNPMVAVDPYGLVSLSLSLYRGFGVGITVGVENGKKFVVADAGLGLGLGFSLNPFGGFPRGETPDSSCPVQVDGVEAFLGAQGTIGATLGPFGVGGTGYTGWHLYRREGRLQRPRFVEGSQPNIRARTFREWLRVGLQLSGGFRGGFAFE